MFIIPPNYLNKLRKAWKEFIGMALCFLVFFWCVLNFGNIGRIQITILVCCEILISLIFACSDFSGQVLELSKLPSEDEVCYESCL
jgi:hypothetical protein